MSDVKKDINKAINEENEKYMFTPEQAVALVAAGAFGGTALGRVFGTKFASKAKRAAEAAAMKRAAKDGSLGWGRGKDASVILGRQRRGLAGSVLGGTSATGAAVYAGTRKKENRK